jgi:multicomponent Na+:H+ antiporter subunit B
MKRLVSLFFIGALALLLLYVVSRMPPMGDPGNPTATRVVPRYLERAEEETHARNVVTGIIINYRGFDTLGEVTVIYCALAAVLAVLGREKRGRIRDYVELSGFPSSVIVRTMVALVVPFILLFSLYTILHGEISPGGGFQGGAVIGASMIIFTTIYGLHLSSVKVSQGLRSPLEGSAVITFFLVGVLGLFGGGNFLTYAWPKVSQALHPALVTWLTVLVEVGIGLGGAMVLVSILFAMVREEGADEPLA